MKKIFSLALLLFVFTLSASEEDIRQAINMALNEAGKALKQAPFQKKTVAVLPFKGDTEKFLVGRLKNLITAAGFTCVEGKEDPAWGEILKEIAWDERKDDILNPATLVKFGRLKAARILVYGKVIYLEQNAERVFVELELHATDLLTKQHIWGGTFAARYYVAQGVKGIVSLDYDLKELLQKSFSFAQQSLNSPFIQKKLKNIRSVTVIPLAADIDQYITSLAIEMLSNTSLYPKNPQIPSLAQVRAFIRDQKLDSDAVFYGAIRDLNQKEIMEKQRDNTTMRKQIVVSADIQLFLENVKTGEILWSKTLAFKENMWKNREMTTAEQEKYQAKREAREAQLKKEREAREEKLKKEKEFQEAKLRKEKAVQEAKLQKERNLLKKEAKQDAELKLKQQLVMQQELVARRQTFEAQKALLEAENNKQLCILGGVILLFLLIAAGITLVVIKLHTSYHNVR